MTAPDDLDEQLTAFLGEGPTDLPDPSFDAVRDRTESTRQRVVLGPWRVPDMNKFLAVGLGGAAVVAVLLIGANLLGQSGNPPGGEPPPSVAPSEAPSEPGPSGWTGLEAGPFLITGDNGALDGGPVEVTVEIAAPGWTYASENDYVGKNDDGLDAPDTVGAALIAWNWPAGTGFNVYGDPCRWTTTTPETPATTPGEIAAAFAEQAETEATAPVDITIGGYSGMMVTVSVPMSYAQPGAPREEVFGDCDESLYNFYGTEQEPMRNAQGAGQVDELWILDVEGSIVILDAVYSPATPADLVDELRAMAESATFELP